MSAPDRAFTARHVQLARALFAAIAALMITFSSDHSAAIGLSVFGGFAVGTALVLSLGAWLAVPKGRRAPLVLLAVIDLIAGVIAGIPALQGDDLFFALVVSWAMLTGLVEVLFAIRARRGGDPTARDGIIAGVLGLLLGVLMLLIPSGFVLDYFVEGAGDLTLTGIILGVGMFGGYACFIAVLMGIAGFSPTPPSKPVESAADAGPTSADSGAATSAPAETSGGVA